MKGEYHLIISIVFGFVIWLIVFLLPWISFNYTLDEIPAIFFSFIAGLVYCDLDQVLTRVKIRDWRPFKHCQHRWFLSHSIIIALPLLLIWRNFYVAFFTFNVGLHLAFDAIKDPSKQVGYWCISWKEGEKGRFSGPVSYGWLAINAFFGIFTSILVMLI